MVVSFLKKKEKLPPIDRVKELSSKGFSEIEIIDILRKEGYTPAEIDLALSSVLKESIERGAVEKVENREHKKEEIMLPKKEEQKPKETHSISQTILPQQQDYSNFSWEDYFNYIDYLIQSRISEISNQFKTLESKYALLEKRLSEIVEENKSRIYKDTEFKNEILSNLKILEERIKELSLKIESMEEILKEVLPALIESVRMLSQTMKKQA